MRKSFCSLTDQEGFVFYEILYWFIYQLGITNLVGECPNSTILDGLAIRGNDYQNKQDSVRNEVSDWLSGLGY